ncbi:MAG: STAS domain-containing protein [Pseudomonadota bacterium]
MTHRERTALVFKTGRFHLSGRVDFQTVPALFKDGERQFAGHHRVTIDGSGITHANSAALSLWLQWAELMRVSGGRMLLRSIPDSLVRLARVSQVSELLGLEDQGG